MSINISETFGPVLQGEGFSSGVPAFFVRMSMCNLMCGGHQGQLMKDGKATWWCDSEVIWKKGRAWEVKEVSDFMAQRGELERILKGRTHVILTGGEPTLPNNIKGSIELVEHLRDLAHEYNEKLVDKTQFAKPFFEIETNGTRYTDGFFDKYVDQINCSPKLANSGMTGSMRVVPKALQEINNHRNSWFKFVVTKMEDWDEIVREYLPYIDKDKIILMPGGTDIEELEVTSKVVWDMACRENIRACNRLQVITWRKTVGV